jgi:sugar lactone lactonase YvrE
MEINRADLNGSNAEFVFNASMMADYVDERWISGFTLYNEILYIKTTTLSCISYDMVTRNQQIFNEDFASGIFFNYTFYYTDKAQRTFTIYGTDLETGNTDIIRGDGITFYSNEPIERVMYDSLAVANDNLFYSTRTNPPAVYLYDEGGQDLLIEYLSQSGTDFNIIRMTTDNNYLYYSCQNSNLLRRYNPDTNTLEIIEIPNVFNITSHFIVVRNTFFDWSTDTGLISYTLPSVE